jgi:hypothetical protein
MRHASRRASQSMGQAADRVRHVALLLSNAAVFTKEPSGFVSLIDKRPGWFACLCVTGSVAVGTQRDSQDTTGQTSIVERKRFCAASLFHSNPFIGRVS